MNVRGLAESVRKTPWARRVLVTISALALLVGIASSNDGDTVGVVDAATSTIGLTVPSGGVEHTMVVDGVRRTFRTFAPAHGHDLPLLVVLHGRAQSAASVTRSTGFLPLVQEGRAALMFPDGIGRSWDAGGGCCGAAATHRVADVQFVTAAVTQVVHELSVDPARVYLVGYSNGGKLAYRETCAEPGMFAAVATYGAVPLAPCANGPTTPFLLSVGQLDPVLPYGGSPHAHPALPPVTTAVGWLRTQDGCTSAATTWTLGSAVLKRWTGCRSGAEVLFVRYPYVGHVWPTTSTVGAVAATPVIWSFLAGHRLGGGPGTVPPPHAA